MARVGDEVADALALFADRGWLAEPETYHQEPPPPEGIRRSSGRSANVRFTRLSWLDGYEPSRDEPGRDRFLDYRVNRVARAAILQHRSEERPWLICLHGFGMGQPGLDLRAFRALHLHRDLGLNLAFLTLPFHGRRNPGPASSPPMPSADALDTVHGLAQAVWDVRQLLRHLRGLSEHPVGLMGLSLGGLVAAVAASVDEPDAVLLLVPAVDLPTLMAAAAASTGMDLAAESELLELASPLFAPVSPLRLDPRPPVGQRSILAGTLDRFARPSTQAIALWRHWERPAIHWYHGGHVSMFWAKGVQATIDDQLRSFGLAAGA
jgi:pimeloyl-ACP methyl ester carboxylesterase